MFTASLLCLAYVSPPGCIAAFAASRTACLVSHLIVCASVTFLYISISALWIHAHVFFFFFCFYFCFVCLIQTCLLLLLFVFVKVTLVKLNMHAYCKRLRTCIKCSRTICVWTLYTPGCVLVGYIHDANLLPKWSLWLADYICIYTVADVHSYTTCWAYT